MPVTTPRFERFAMAGLIALGFSLAGPAAAPGAAPEAAPEAAPGAAPEAVPEAVPGAAPEAAGQGPYPVWWSEVLELDSLDTIDARLDRALSPDDPEGLPLIKRDGDKLTEVRAVNCVELERRVGAGYHGIGSNGFGLQLYNQALCAAIGMMRRPQPAERSFLREFALDEDAIHHLPALVNIYPSCDFQCRQGLANTRRIPLIRFEPVMGVQIRSDDEIKIWTIEWAVTLTILARGDFNGDGLDDLLMLASGGGTVGTWRGAESFLLTRDAPDAVLTVLEVGRNHYAPYQCDATYDDPPVLHETDPRRGATGLSKQPRTILFGAIGEIDYPGEFLPPMAGPAYPVWWWPLLGVEYRDKVDDYLSRQDWLSGDSTMLEIESTGRIVVVSAKSCQNLLSKLDRGYRLAARQRSRLPIIAHCGAVEVLQQMRPAMVSHLRGLVLDDQVLAILPALLGAWTSPCPPCLSRALNESDKSWAGFAAERMADHEMASFSDGRPYRLDIRDERTLRVRTPGRTIEVQFLAGGDYDGDGLDDVLVRRDLLSGSGAYEDSTLFILTRESPNAVLRVVSADFATAPNDGCDGCRVD